MNKQLSKSLKKYVRLEKGRIRRESGDLAVQKEAINKLYQKMGLADLVVEKAELQNS
ncbi:MAG: hypothetical protein NTV62_01555 [Candidatus Gribaldobacteria bacterium]|nr:hypothetical protein [Candidatus Gribaldobacteria bacterium]